MRVYIAIFLLAICSVARADCFDNAANYFRVNELVLRAFAQRESNFNPTAVHYNRNGTYDVGIMQINSVNFPELEKFGITEADLFKACDNIYVGAWYLRKMINLWGNNKKAIAMYNPGDPKYADRILETARKIRNQRLELMSRANSYIRELVSER